METRLEVTDFSLTSRGRNFRLRAHAFGTADIFHTDLFSHSVIFARAFFVGILDIATDSAFCTRQFETGVCDIKRS